MVDFVYLNLFLSLTHSLTHTHSLSLSHTQGSFPSDLPEDSLRFSLLSVSFAFCFSRSRLSTLAKASLSLAFRRVGELGNAYEWS